MEFLKEESFLIDYLKSFELLDMQDDMEENNSLLDRVIDSNYKKKILLYVEELNRDFQDSVTRYFIGEKFNLLFSIANDNEIKSFKALIGKLDNYTLDELYETLRGILNLQSDISLQNIEELSLSFKDKWKLAILINEFADIKMKLIFELSNFYETYVEYAEALYKDYFEKISRVETVLSEGEFLYQNIFREYVEKKIFDGIDRRLILLLSANEIIMYNTRRSHLIGIGLYVLDFYLEMEKQKKIDEIKMTQIFKSLADPTRYGIIKSLNKGITSNSVLADMFSVSRAAISLQFKHLQANDMIIVDDETKQYAVNKDVIKYAIEKLQMDIDLLDE